MSAVTEHRALSPDSEVFDRWAAVYDTDGNPLLRLEERILMPLLQPTAGTHWLDVGCGTGRWLQRLEQSHTHSLTGLDCSSAMLDRARRKISPATLLLQSDCVSLPLGQASQDGLLCSFVLSYLQDLPAFAADCARVLKPGGCAFITDMHPRTAAARGWTRSFAVQGDKVEIAAGSYPLEQIVACFAAADLELLSQLEPSFGLAERPLFEQAGRLDEYEILTTVPAIYLLKLQKRDTAAHTPATQPASLQLINARWSAGPTEWQHSVLTIDQAQIAQRSHDEGSPETSLDLSGFVLLPGLVNAHDHLEFALFPNLGRSLDATPYRNSADWAREIQQRHAGIIALHKKVPLKTRLWWGAIRNLLCGVTTVCHHNPLHPDFTEEDFPVRVLKDFSWTHSLAFGEDIAARHQESPADQPFIIHAGEGVDEGSRDELQELDRLGVIDPKAVLVHGLACSPANIALLNQRKAALILCPTSNRFLFHQSPSSSLISSIDRAALGSDSPLTAAGDLLDEVQTLSAQGIDAAKLYSLVTTSPAEILHLQHGEGFIQPGSRADLIAVRETSGTPAETLARLSFHDIELVLLAGRVQLASPALYARLSPDLRAGLEPLNIAGHQRWLRAPLAAIFKSAEAVLGRGNLRLGGREVQHVAAL